MNCMTLREICETLEVSRRTIQGYEKAGLVAATGRNKYGHLLYDDTAKLRIAQIKFCQQLGFTIKEITVIIDAPNVVLKSALEQQVQKLRKEKTEINELIEKANQMIARL
ncbi:MAG: MerR family transcriptional regulator [Lachnospiraceae bacterium]|nr:MerR family transcriptional regulator [Lachnospiraceae bacterium]